MTGEPISTRKYRGKLGHSEVLVECSSKEEAIQLARKKLSADMPWLYNVIYGKNEKRFQVNEVDKHSSP